MPPTGAISRYNPIVPTQEPPFPRPIPLRLAAALALSSIAHVTVLVTTREAHVQIDRRPVILNATLMPPSAGRPSPAVEPPQATGNLPDQSAPLPPPAKDIPAGAMPMNTPAGLAAPLDLSELEAVELLGSVRLVLRIYVSRLGKLERIEVLESVRVPADFLAAVMERLSSVPMVAAQTDHGPVAASFDIVIAGEPMAEGPGREKPP